MADTVSDVPASATRGASLEPFPPTFYYANGIELFERLAHYGMYVGLALYLTNVVGYGDVAVGALLGNFRFVGSLAPVPCGGIADRISFKRSLILAFGLYAAGYIGLFAYPSRLLAPFSLLLLAVGGGFLKPVITATVVRTAPPGRQVEGFAIFYRMVNSGSVVGKSLAYLVRVLVALRFVMITSVLASLVALALSIFGYREPRRGGAAEAPPRSTAGAAEPPLAAATPGAAEPPAAATLPAAATPGAEPSFTATMRGYADALKDLRFSLFLVLFAGFYFMSEQFYMTFPKYVTRHIDAKAPLEIITLVNPALVAIGQGFITRQMKRFQPITTMVLGVLIASLSMLVMGALPTLVGACLSGMIFACAEMTFAPRFYAYIASFAPSGKAGMYMGLSFVPAAIGAWIGGQVSGNMIARYLPATGPRSPFTVWATYSALGLGCALLMLVYRRFATPQAAPAAQAI